MTPDPKPAQKDPAAPAEMAEHVAQNIEAIATLHARGEEKLSRQQRAIENFTTFLGRPQSAYAIIAAVALWITGNVLAPRFGLIPVDAAPFPWLQGTVSLCALLMTFLVLTTQNRQGGRATKRDHLDLQINLGAEQKIAKLIALVEELRRDLPSVRNRVDPVAEAMAEAFDPHAVLTALEQTLDESPAKGSVLARGAAASDSKDKTDRT